MNKTARFAVFRLLSVAGVVSLGFCASADDKTAAGAGGKSPAAADVIAKSIEAIGGKEAILKHTSIAMKGKWEIAAMSQGGDFEMLKAKPSKQVLRIKLGDQGQMVNGYDGKVGWTMNPFAGAMLFEGKLLDQTAEEAEFYNVLHRDSDYKSMETIGPARMDGKDCVELKLVTRSGREIHEFYDAKTGLLVATRGIQESPQGANEVTLIFSDYKKMGDLLQAGKLRVKVGDFEQVITISTVEYDAVPDKEFELPADVKALLKK